VSEIRVFTIGVGQYDNEPSWNVDVSASIELITAELSSHGALVEDLSAAAVNESRGSGTYRDVLKKIRDHDRPRLVYWTGHGEHSDHNYLAALADSESPLDSGNAVTETPFADAIRDGQLRREGDQQDNWLILILDTCGSVGGAHRIRIQFTEGLPRNTAVIATSAGDATANVGVFAKVLQDKLLGFPEETEIELKELVRRIEEHLDKGFDDQHVHYRFVDPSPVLPRRVDAPPVGTTTTVDSYAELREVLKAASEEVRNHFYAKAQGAEMGEPAWHFTGREVERQLLIRWLTEARSGMFVVTGIAGSGKSALLGMLYASSDPNMLDALEGIGYQVREDLRPPAYAFDAAVHLSQTTVHEAIRNLAVALGVPDATTSDALAEQAKRALAARPRTVLVDALDECRDALTVGALLRRLAGLDGLRLVVGTRQSLHEDPDHPEPPDRDLLDSLGAAAENTLVLGRDPAAVESYAKSRLRKLLGDAITEQQITRIAADIRATEQPFLFARLAVHEVNADRGLIDSPAELDELLASGHQGIFAHAVTRLRSGDPRVEALLHALAYARGNGMPRTGAIWETAATALSGLELTDRNVSDTLDAAAPYIMQSAEFGHTVYRLAHRTFNEWYWRADAAE